MKILLTTMGLGIGGAETHIVELAKKLKNAGHAVTVISNGGEYVSAITEVGIRHIDAPMHRRSPSCMAKSYGILKKVVREMRPDVIHAHARIPAFLSYYVAKKTNTAFVTTVHGWYKTDGILRMVTRWGNHALAVSDDIRTYLKEQYNLPDESITVTVNGIDTERFSPRGKDEAILSELGISRTDRVILSVSRMDEGACLAAKTLLDSATEIREKHSDIKIVLVGGGDALPSLSEQARDINAAVGEEFIKVAGVRMDIERFISIADLFVGVSRAALEALSCNVPTILLGDAGYLGLYDKDKKKRCIETNFTCRGCEAVTAPQFLEDVERALCLTETEKKNTNGRDVVAIRYSLQRMMEDSIMVYKRAKESASFDFLLVGYYGFDNTGDEAMLGTIVSNLRQQMPEANICALAKKGVEYPHLNIHTVDRFSMRAVKKAIRQSRSLIFGGGNLIQDVTSAASAFYYLSLLNLAKKQGIATMLYANGIGPLRESMTRKQASKTLNTVDIITVREKLSVEYLQTLEVKNPKIILTADEIFTLPAVQECEVREFLTISVRAWGQNDSEFVEKMAQIAMRVAEKYGLKIRLLPLMPLQDNALAEEICERIGKNCQVLSSEHYSDVQKHIAKSRFVIAMRLHALIFAQLQNVPFFSVSYDEKIDAFCEYIGDYGKIPSSDIDVDKVIADIDNALAREDEIRTNMKNKMIELRKLASENARIACELLK